VILFIIVSSIALLTIIAIKWANGIDKYKDYKGEDFLNN
jgi:hypothetical protein